LPDCAPDRDVYRQRQCGTTGRHSSRKDADAALVAGSDADFVYCATLVVNSRLSSPIRGDLLVDLSVAEGKLILRVRGADKLWAFKSSLEIPLVHIGGIRADPEAARGWYHGIRMPGTNVPGVITAGTFYQDGKRIFWDVHHPEKTIVIDLHDERYSELVVEVDDPDAAVELVKAALPR
jgi:hypothetical protein